MNSIAMPCSVFSSRSNSRICACTVTSSAVVGSSAISSSGSVGQRHGDHHPLPLTARKLVRIGGKPFPGLADADLVEQVENLVRASSGRICWCRCRISRNLLLDRLQRIERGHRLLEDHGDVVAAHLPDLRFGRREEILALEQDLT
jgi:hypothetical protein